MGQSKTKTAPSVETVDNETGEIKSIALPVDAALSTSKEDLEKALDLDESPWLPEVGAKITGWVVQTKEVPSDFPPGSYPLIKVFTDEGTIVNVHAFHTVLRSGVANFQPSYGDRIAVKYVGFHPTPDGTFEGYQDYRMIVVKPQRQQLSV